MRGSRRRTSTVSAGTEHCFPVEVSEYLGLRPTWVDATNVGGSSWEVMAGHAAAAIAAGEIEVALLTYGSTARSDVKRQLRASAAAMATGGALQYEAPTARPSSPSTPWQPGAT